MFVNFADDFASVPLERGILIRGGGCYRMQKRGGAVTSTLTYTCTTHKNNKYTGCVRNAEIRMKSHNDVTETVRHNYTVDCLQSNMEVIPRVVLKTFLASTGR